MLLDREQVPSTEGGSTGAMGAFVTVVASGPCGWARLRASTSPAPRSGPDSFAVEQQLARMVGQPSFAVSPRLVTLLRFLCSAVLQPDGAPLREVTIGNVLYQRSPPYDPRVDCTVRVEARRLRKKLEAYYAKEGITDPVRIDLPIGGYVPSFAFNVPTARTARAVT